MDILQKINEINTINSNYIKIVKSNTSLLHKREFLIKMLLDLDNILSESNLIIKSKRKNLIVRISKTLDYIDKLLNIVN